MPKPPLLRDLGYDLTRISPARRVFSLVLPFAWAIGYFLLAYAGYWVEAVACLVALSFVTYGSVSHDLVHRTLGLPRRFNDAFLVAIELLALRSGTAYRLARLHHHRRYPSEDDIEGAAASMSFFRAVMEGVIAQPKLYQWAWARRPQFRPRLGIEGLLIAFFLVASLVAIPWTLVPLVYVLLMIAGSWTIPFVTAYLPHVPEATSEVYQTRAFRGTVLSILAVEHLYHLEHHLYPAVPHHNWPELARRLDPYLRTAGVQPARLWF